MMNQQKQQHILSTLSRQMAFPLSLIMNTFLASILTSCVLNEDDLSNGGDQGGSHQGGSHQGGKAGIEEVEWLSEAELTEEGVVMSVWGNQQSVYGVGGQPNQGRIWRRNLDDQPGDGLWNPLTTVPNGPLLNWVHGVEDQLWVVGNDGRALRSIDGGEWTSFDTGTTQDLWGVFAVSTREVWAVGGNASGDGQAAPVLIRFDGEQWSSVPVPELDRSGVRAFFKVWGDGEGRVWVVGMKGVIIADLGNGWSQQTVIPNGNTPPNSEDLISLWGNQGEILAVGGRSNGVIARWDGTTWRSQIISGLPGLNGVWMDQNGIAHAVGIRGSAITVAPNRFEIERQRTYSSMVLHAIWSDGVRRWAVGGTLDNSPPWEGLIIAD